MKTYSPQQLVFLLFLCLISCSKDGIYPEQFEAGNLSIEVSGIQKDVIEYVNAYREDHDLPYLEYMSVIKDVAAKHTDYMIEKGEVNHDYFFTREKDLEEKANAVSVGENVAYAYSTAEGVVNAWINSDKHRDNIEGDFTHIGVSAKKNREGRIYYTLMFIKK